MLTANTITLRRHLSLIAIVAAFLVLGYATSSFSGFDVVEAVEEFPAGFVWFIVQFMPTVDSLEHLGRILPAMLSTVLDSVAAGVTGAVVAYVCAVIGSRTVGLGGAVQLVVRAVASVLRNIPIVAWAFLLLFSFRQSEFTGYLALFLQSFGFLTRCFLETIDEMSTGPIEALRACGATYAQVVVRGVIPLTLSQVLSWTLYMIETNFRDATLVGMLTGTGIGFVFDLYYRSFRYDSAGLTLLVIVVVVIACEALSNYVRRRVG